MGRSNAILRFLDYYLGISLIFLLRIFKISLKREIPEKIFSIGILKPVAIGDLTLLTGPLQDIREKYPWAKIILFIGDSNKILKGHIPAISESIVINMKNPIAAIMKIRKYRFDIFLDFCSWPRINALLTFFSKSRFNVGFNTKGQFRHFLYDYAVEHSNAVHEIENYRDILRFLKIKCTNLPRLFIGKSMKIEWKNFCVIHLSAGGYRNVLREVSFQQWKVIYEYLSYRKMKVIMTGSLEDFEKNQEFCNFTRNSHNLINIAGKYPFAKVLRILDSAEVVISVNTGIAHVAATLSCRVIVLNGPTNPIRWGALGAYNILAANGGYLNLGFEYGKRGLNVMQNFDISLVISQLERIFLLPKKRIGPNKKALQELAKSPRLPMR